MNRFAARWFHFPSPALLVVAILLGGVSGSDVSQAVEPTSPPAEFPAAPELADYLAWAGSHSPRLGGQAARNEVLHQNARRAGALPDLKLAWGEMIVPVETRVGPQQRVFSVSQSFPWFGTLSAVEGSLEAEAAAGKETLRGLELQVGQEVRQAWYELAFIEGQILIVTENLDLARQTEAYVRTKYETGNELYTSVLNAQMEIGRLDTRLSGLRDRLLPAAARLNVAAGLSPDLAAPEIGALPAELLDADLPADDELVDALRRGSPTLASLRWQEEGRRQGVTAAGRRAYPDFTLGVDYIMTGEAAMAGVTDSGKDPVIARVAVSVPLWGGQSAADRRAAAGLLRAAGEGVTETRLRLEARLQDILFAWREAGRNRELYGVTLLPRSAQNLAVITASYEAGQADFDQLQAARQSQLGLELARLRADTDRALALNDLGALLGVSPEALARGELPVSAAEPESEQE